MFVRQIGTAFGEGREMIYDERQPTFRPVIRNDYHQALMREADEQPGQPVRACATIEPHRARA